MGGLLNNPGKHVRNQFYRWNSPHWSPAGSSPYSMAVSQVAHLTGYTLSL